MPLFALLSVFFFFYTNTQLWVLFLALSVFYGFIDFVKVKKELGTTLDNYNGAKGILDYYDVDGEKCYGLYFDLAGESVFIDIKQDKLIEERKARALYIFENSRELDESLAHFLDSNVQYRSKKINSIGLHSDEISRGEVFWEPDGYTLLLGSKFVT